MVSFKSSLINSLIRYFIRFLKYLQPAPASATTVGAGSRSPKSAGGAGPRAGAGSTVRQR